MTRMMGAVCAAAFWTLGGCAIVNLAGAPDTVSVDPSTMAPAQVELRGAASALEAAAREAGWSPTNTDEGIHRALAVLLHGRDAVGDGDQADPVDIYLDANTRDHPQETFVQLAVDIEAAAAGARRVNDAAEAVIAEGAVDRATLDEDVRAVERCIGVARRARTLIGDAVARLAGRVGAEEPEDLLTQLATLDGEIGRMSELADVLNALRMSGVEESAAAVVG